MVEMITPVAAVPDVVLLRSRLSNCSTWNNFAAAGSIGGFFRYKWTCFLAYTC